MVAHTTPPTNPSTVFDGDIRAAHHFLNYARQVAGDLEQECRALESAEATANEGVAAGAKAGASR
jgi:hypothetical protein